jgi:hypothetical protein
MAFVNEYMSGADAEKYGIEAINNRFIVGGTRARDWTIDGERDVYLRIVATGREEMASRSTWTLFRNGVLIVVELDLVRTTGGVGKPSSSHYKLLRLDMPSSLQSQKYAVLDDLRAALICYRDGGVYATATAFSLTLDLDIFNCLGSPTGGADAVSNMAGDENARRGRAASVARANDYFQINYRTRVPA